MNLLVDGLNNSINDLSYHLFIDNDDIVHVSVICPCNMRKNYGLNSRKSCLIYTYKTRKK